MNTSRILDVILGLSFTYFVLSLLCTALSELIASAAGLRQATLERGLRQLLGSAEVQAKLYAHPLVASMQHGSNSRTHKPSYLSREVFASALLDLVRTGAVATEQLDRTRQAVSALLAGTRAGGALDASWSQLATHTAEVHAAAGRWFDDGMARVSGAYKRLSQVVVLGVALAIAGVGNADTVAIARSLWFDADLRRAVVEQAGAYIAPGRAEPEADVAAAFRKADAAYATATRELGATHLPLGWPRAAEHRRGGGWLREGEDLPGKLAGILLTALALSLGAPFWFDTLTRIARLRGAGPRPEPGPASGPTASPGAPAFGP